jgi:NADPH oxidase
MFNAFQTLLSLIEQQYRSSGTAVARYLRLHIYDTREVDTDTMHNIVLNSVGTEFDPITELHTLTTFGKHNFEESFSSIRNACEDTAYVEKRGRAWWNQPGRVGVYFCGPSSTAEEIREACDYATSREVVFKLWKGHP